MRLTINEAKSRFDELVDLAYEGGEEIIVNGDENRGVAIISLDEYESLKSESKEKKLDKFMEFVGAFEVEDRFKNKSKREIKKILVREKYED